MYVSPNFYTILVNGLLLELLSRLGQGIAAQYPFPLLNLRQLNLRQQSVTIHFWTLGRAHEN